MSEYCEYMWGLSDKSTSVALARSLYEEKAKIEVRDKKLAVKTVRAILQGMPNVDLKHCTDEYITRFLLARKYRTEQAAALIVAYQAQIAHRQDIFGNLTARDPALQRALRAGIPGVLPARDRKGRCVLVVLASQWDPIAVPALAVQRAIFLVLEILIQDPRNQQSGFVAVIDWSGFSLRQGGALGAAALRNLIAALRGRFPARFKAVHFLSSPLCVQATLALVKPFLDEKTRNKIYLHGNNLSTLHEHLPTDILPAELGGTGPAFNPGLWAEPVIHSAMKEAELAAIKKEKERANENKSTSNSFDETRKGSINVMDVKSNVTSKNGLNEGDMLCYDQVKSGAKNLRDENKTKGSVDSSNADLLKRNPAGKPRYKDFKDEQFEKDYTAEPERRIIHDSEYKSGVVETSSLVACDKNVAMQFREYQDKENNESVDNIDCLEGNEGLKDNESLELHSETNSNEFEMVPSYPDSEDSKDNSLDIRVEKIVVRTGKSDILPEETNLILQC